VLWTIIPVFLVAIIVAFVFYKLPDVSDVSRAANEPANEPNLKIDVRGHQFYWEFRYPDGSVTYDTMVVPVNRTVELDVTSQVKDVIHSWWIPALGGKIDAIPVGSTTRGSARSGRRLRGATAPSTAASTTREMVMNVHALPAGGSTPSSSASRPAAARSSRPRARSATTCRARSSSARRCRGTRRSPTQRRSRRSCETGETKMPAVGAGWTDEQIGTS
jgi:hypothetical protein